MQNLSIKDRPKRKRVETLHSKINFEFKQV